MRQSEIRKDYIQEKYVLIAPRRTQRPHDLERPERLVPPKKETCVFCPERVNRVNKTLQTISQTKEKNEPWAIKVVANKFPAVNIKNPKAYGRQEVIIETPNHLKEIEELSDQRVAEILKVYAERSLEIMRDKKISYILIFKNNGGAAGASLQHAHSQIFASQFLPPHLRDKSERISNHLLKYGDCVYCNVIKKERQGPRLIAEDKLTIAFCPWAPMHNYEVWIMPKRHLDSITDVTTAERLSLAKMLKKILHKINQLGLPYNYYCHQVVRDKNQHLYIKITPRGSVWAGVEVGSGLIINPIPPEDAAKFYRGK